MPEERSYTLDRRIDFRLNGKVLRLTPGYRVTVVDERGGYCLVSFGASRGWFHRAVVECVTGGQK